MLHTLCFSLQNAVSFIMLPFLLHVLFIFYIKVCWNLNVKLQCQKVKLLKILPLSAQYIYTLLMSVVNNRNLFLDNVDLYSIQTWNSYNLYPPSCHLTKYQKGVHYAAIRVFSQLPTSIKSVANGTKVFKKMLKRFLMDN